jgi:hypothetical protein
VAIIQPGLNLLAQKLSTDAIRRLHSRAQRTAG